MALFGVPSATELDAANTLHCAIDMIDELARWNAKRVMAGRSPIEVAVSANYGTAVLGDIGKAWPFATMSVTSMRSASIPPPAGTSGQRPAWSAPSCLSRR